MNDKRAPLKDAGKDVEKDVEKDDAPMTRQSDVDAVPGRQKYRSARPPGDYTEDFGTDGAIAHPVKGEDEKPASD